jgi:hypothetical protein
MLTDQTTVSGEIKIKYFIPSAFFQFLLTLFKNLLLLQSAWKIRLVLENKENTVTKILCWKN